LARSIYSIQHNPDYFPSPYNFDPNRWLGSDSPNHYEKSKLANAAFNPFSVGPRACAGRSIGLAELHIMFARTMFAYDFRIADGPLGSVGQGSGKNGDLRSCESEFQLFAHVTSYCEGPWVVFKAR
jgi:cytochrome P450